MLENRRLFFTADGSHSVSTEIDGVTYHSKHGAVQESQHVFIDAGLSFRAHSEGFCSILEIGFGTGLNAFMTLLEAEKKAWPVQYTTYELFPLSIPQIKTLNYPEVLNALPRKADFEVLHTCAWEEIQHFTPFFSFQKHQQSFWEIADIGAYDIIYFDPFAPETQPEWWEIAFLQKMYDALKPQGVLTTYCAKGIVKRRLKSVGFEVNTLPGPPGKREMTRAVK